MIATPLGGRARRGGQGGERALVDSWTGTIRAPFGQLPFFVDFLKTSGLFDAFVSDCPLRYQSPNAPKRHDVLGTTMLSMLAGHKRSHCRLAMRRRSAGTPGDGEDRQ